MTEFTPLDEVWFVVSPHNPLKKKESLLDDYQRLYMAQLAIGDNDRLKATDIEFKLAVSILYYQYSCISRREISPA